MNHQTLADAEKIDILAKLLSENETIPDDQELSKSYDETLDLIAKKFSDMLVSNAVPNSDYLLDKMKEILSGVEFFQRYPETIGDVFIGVMGCPGNVLREMEPGVTESFGKKCRSVPVFWTHGKEDKVIAENIYDVKTSLNEEDIEKVFALANDWMDMKKILQLLYITKTDIPANKTYVDIPAYCEEDILKRIIAKLDVLFVYYGNRFAVSKLNEIGGALSEAHTNLIFVVPLKTRSVVNKIHGKFGNGVSVISASQMKEEAAKYGGSKLNYTFVDAMRLVLAAYEYRYDKRNHLLRTLVKQLKEDAVQAVNDDTQESLISNRKDIESLLKDNESKQKAFRLTSWKLLTSAQHLEELFRKIAKGSSDQAGKFDARANTCYLWFRLAHSYLQIYRLDHDPAAGKNAEKYVKALQEYAETPLSKTLSSLAGLEFDDAYGQTLSIEKLREMSKVDCGKIPAAAGTMLYFYDKGKLLLSSTAVLRLASLLKEPVDALENYYKGYYYEQYLKPEQARTYYLRAWRDGFDKAAEKLVPLAENGSVDLVDFLVPDACLDIGMRKLRASKTDRRNEALFYLKVAAAGKNVKAIEALAVYYYKHRQSGKSKEDKDRENTLLSRLFVYISQNDESFKEANKYLGILAYERNDYRKALHYLKLDQTRDAKGLCLLARMYLNGHGVSKDMDMAEKYAQMAVNKGSAEGRTIMDKIEEKKEEQARKEEKEREEAEKTVVEEEHVESDDSCCHVVTATCKALGIDRKIYHRTVYIVRHLRNVADRVDKENSGLIRAYYAYAPDIVSKINADPKAAEVYEECWNNYIKPCVEHTRKRDYKAAWKLYVGMCYRACVKYHVGIPESIMERAAVVIAE